MNDSESKYYLYINGQKVPVSEQVFKEYQHFERKDRYFFVDLKSEKFVCNQATQAAVFIPSREDSYERLLELNKQFPDSDADTTEDTVIKIIMLERLQDALATLPEDEMELIKEFFYLARTERQISEALHVAASTLRDRKKAILRKLRKIIE